MRKQRRSLQRKLEKLAPEMNFDSSGDERVQAIVQNQLAQMLPGDVCYTHPNSIPPQMRSSAEHITASVAKVGYTPAFGSGYDRVFGKK